MIRALLVTLTIALLTVVDARAAETLQPGARLDTGCTLNFVYDGQGPLTGRVFIGTAAHCIEKVGQRVKDAGGIQFGTVVLSGFPEEWTGFDRPNDFALIEVDADHRARVDPAMAGHPEMPSGVASDADVAEGDLLQMSGWGGIYNQTEDTREQRQAVLTEWRGGMFNSMAPVNGGDSGGPLAHVDTGLAAGTVSGWDFLTPGNLNGPTVENILVAAAALGFPTRMRLAGEPPPPPPPSPPPPPPPAAPASSPPASSPSKPAAKRKRKASMKKCRKGKKRSRRSKRCRRARRSR